MGKVRIDRWLGLYTNASPYSIPLGASVNQTNLQIRRPGELLPRPGMDTVYTANDYDEVIGVYRVSNGSSVADTLLVCSKPNASTTRISYLTPLAGTGENAWTAAVVHSTSTTATASPTFAEDRHGRIYCFMGEGQSPVVIDRSAAQAVTMGIPAPTVAPTVTPTGNGYFIERVDVLDGGGSYWAPPPTVITGGGTPLRAARLKTIIQGGSVVSVDVIDGGTGYTSPPTITVDESGVKGTGFLGYGKIGTDPGLQGFEGTISTTGNTTNTTTSITGIATSIISLLKVGMTVRGTGIPAGATITAISTTSFTISAAATATGTAVVLVINGAAITGTTNAALSHGYDVTPGSVTMAYKLGTGTGFVSATFDSSTQRWSALIPLAPGVNLSTGVLSTGTGAFARVEFTPLVDGTSYSLGGTQDATWPVRPSGAFFGTTTSTMLSPNQANPGSYYAADYWRDTDDNTAYAADLSTSNRGYYQQRFWIRNNHDYFAGLVPNFKIKFHKRRVVEGRYRTNTSTNLPYGLYADIYTYDYSRISFRYFTGARDEIGTAADTDSKWTWATAAVQVANGQPYIDITLTPSLKTGTTAYAQYSTYSAPTVRVYLKYCPDSWLNVATSGDGLNACHLGWQRTDASGNVQTSSTNTLGWWSAGQAASGTSSRPIVDFRQSSSGAAAAGISASTIEIINAGSGMEQDTFFAIQFDQINAAFLFLAAITENATNQLGNVYIPWVGNAAEYSVSWPSGFDLSPTSPAFSTESTGVLNTARSTKTFSDYRQRFYFKAGVQTLEPQGPPGPVVGNPTVAIPGTGFVANDIASLTLRQRANTTSDPTTPGLFSDGQTYTFKSLQITPPSATDKITEIVVSQGGTGYYGVPDMLVLGGGGFGLKLDAVVTNGSISRVNILSAGSGFTSQPEIRADSDTATLTPVLRPSMRGTYRCAYRFADWSQTVAATKVMSTTSGSPTVTITDTAGLVPGMIVEHGSVPFMSKIVSISGTQVRLSANATSTVSSVSATIRDMSKPIFYSDFSPITDVDTTLFTAAPRPTQMTWNISGVTAPSRATVVEFFRTSSDESLVFYRLEMYGTVAGGTVQIQGTDILTDEELFDADRPFYAAVPVVLPNGGLNAYRFGVPRNDMAVAVTYADRLWYGVSTSGQDVNTVFFSEFDEFESCPAINELPIQNNQRSTDSLTALIPFGQYLLAMQSAHCYAISYNSDPTVDAAIQFLAHRGVLGQQCFDLFDNMLFAMDERGIYVMDRNGGVESLSEPIANYFNSGLLDLSLRKRFFLKVDHRTSTLRAFVALKGANATSPHMAFCLNLDTKTWWVETWPNGLTCSCDYRRTLGNPDEPIYGAVDGDIYRADGLRDQQYRTIQSVTVTNGGSGYKTAPLVTVASGQSGCGASFTAILKDGAVSEILIVDSGFGYGAFSGATFLPSVNLSIGAPPAGGTTAMATATATAPILAGDIYPQSTVPFSLKTGAMELANDSNVDGKGQLMDRSITVTYRPTETTATLALREYFNNSPTPRSNVMPRDRGTGFVHDTSGAKTTLDMATGRSPLGPATGVAKAQFAGRNYTDMGGADRHVAVELSYAAVSANSGDPTPSQPLLYGLDVSGVIANGGE